jgi:hypothetical protein
MAVGWYLRLWRDQTAQRFPYGLRHSSAYEGFGAARRGDCQNSALRILIGAAGTLVVRDERLGANIKLQLDIVSFFDIDFERPAEVLADQCAGCASRVDRGVEILIHN